MKKYQKNSKIRPQKDVLTVLQKWTHGHTDRQTDKSTNIEFVLHWEGSPERSVGNSAYKEPLLENDNSRKSEQFPSRKRTKLE